MVGAAAPALCGWRCKVLCGLLLGYLVDNRAVERLLGGNVGRCVYGCACLDWFMSVMMNLVKLPEVELPEDEHLAMEHSAYCNSVSWHDDRIADILREREEQGIDLSEPTPAVTRLLRQGIESIEDGTPSPLFMALLHELAEHAPDEMDSALRKVASTEKIKLANRDRQRALVSAQKRMEVRSAWLARHEHPEHGHRFVSVDPARHFGVFTQFVVPDLDVRTIKQYLQAPPSLLATPHL